MTTMGLFTWRWRTCKVTHLSIFIYFDHVYMRCGVTGLGRLPDLLGRVILSVEVTVLLCKLLKVG